MFGRWSCRRRSSGFVIMIESWWDRFGTRSNDHDLLACLLSGVLACRCGRCGIPVSRIGEFEFLVEMCSEFLGGGLSGKEALLFGSLQIRRTPAHHQIWLWFRTSAGNRTRGVGAVLFRLRHGPEIVSLTGGAVQVTPLRDRRQTKLFRKTRSARTKE